MAKQAFAKQTGVPGFSPASEGNPVPESVPGTDTGIAGFTPASEGIPVPVSVPGTSQLKTRPRFKL